jgi:23S rRNA pseudouridine1911/1915/1917 synthase
MIMERMECTAQDTDTGKRLDTVITAHTGLSRSKVQRLLKQGDIRLNGHVVNRPSIRVAVEDQIEVSIPEAQPLEIAPADIALDILYEDSDLVIVNKQAGLVVHPGPGHPDDTLVNALMSVVHDLSGIGGKLRPGIVHRLDKDTSGVLVVAKNDKAHHALSDQFQSHTVSRRYIALVLRLRGAGLDASGTFDTFYGRDPKDRKRYTSQLEMGKRAVTHYRVLESYPGGAKRVECRLETGRTHQIRVHMAEHGCPILGDTVYGGKVMKSVKLIARHALHAESLGFNHPSSGERMNFTGEFPEDFKLAQEALANHMKWR